ncbi:AraC-like transcriptional regulator QhpR [Acidocella facilis]|uniref:AraC-like transcriptional regulator QhpR n=1 Tax=Acidocella facilis TaxID=525 RepID=UPI001F451679|nr:AraC family transcriptional regulator [Acidocella facilis]
MGVEPHIAAAAAAGIEALIGQCGGDAPSLLAGLALPAARLADPTQRLSLMAYCRLFEQAAAQTGLDDFGLRFGQQYAPEQMGALGALVLASPDLGAALRNLCAYFPVLQEHSCLRLRAQGAVIALEYQIGDGRITQRRQDAELSLAVFAGIFRRALGPGFAPLEVQFEHLRPAGARAASGFRAPVYYAAPRNALLFPAELLAAKMPGADAARLPGLLAALRPQLADGGARDFVGQVLGLIRDGFLNGAAQIDQVAQRLGVSRAGLHRRLRQEGVAFSDLTARIRRELAQDYVGQPGIAFTDIALLLGYSELSAFTRAFTRWTGRSPARYRQACRHAP